MVRVLRVALLVLNNHILGSDSSALNLDMCVGSRNWVPGRNGSDNRCLLHRDTYKWCVRSEASEKIYSEIQKYF